jgi:hypothetical protein
MAKPMHGISSCGGIAISSLKSVCPAATRICERTRSMPVTHSVTVCSTWMRGFISMKNQSF